MASPMPVLPEVPSMIVPPGFSRPGPLGVLDHLDRHAVLDRVARVEGLELGQHRPPGTSRVMRLMRTIGVWPMVSRMVLPIFVMCGLQSTAPLH